MNIYTIKATATGVSVHDGRLKGARLKYEANNVQIYVSGAFKTAQRDKVHYHAMSLMQAHHIPLRQVQNKGWL